MFVLISLIDKKFVSCEVPEQKDRASMVKWAKILGGAGVFFILAAAVVTIWGACLPETATPENSVIAYLNDIGFQAFFFFGVIVGCNAVWLWSDANDKKIDPKGTSLDLKLFETSKTYAWGALAIGVIIVILYVALW
jgi:SSS family solute:Na+ symporter